MTDELKPCPFCGGEAAHGGYAKSPDGYWCACQGCGVSRDGHRTIAEAITAWNTRQQSILSESVNGEAVRERGWMAFVLAAGQIERDVSLHSLTDDEQRQIVDAILDTALPKQPVNLDGEAVERVREALERAVAALGYINATCLDRETPLKRPGNAARSALADILQKLGPELYDEISLAATTTGVNNG